MDEQEMKGGIISSRKSAPKKPEVSSGIVEMREEGKPRLEEEQKRIAEAWKTIEEKQEDIENEYRKIAEERKKIEEKQKRIAEAWKMIKEKQEDIENEYRKIVEERKKIEAEEQKKKQEKEEQKRIAEAWEWIEGEREKQLEEVQQAVAEERKKIEEEQRMLLQERASLEEARSRWREAKERERQEEKEQKRQIEKDMEQKYNDTRKMINELKKDKYTSDVFSSAAKQFAALGNYKNCGLLTTICTETAYQLERYEDGQDGRAIRSIVFAILLIAALVVFHLLVPLPVSWIKYLLFAGETIVMGVLFTVLVYTADESDLPYLVRFLSFLPLIYPLFYTSYLFPSAAISAGMGWFGVIISALIPTLIGYVVGFVAAVLTLDYSENKKYRIYQKIRRKYPA